MKVKEVFQLIKPLKAPEIIVYDTKTNEGFVYESTTGSSIQDCIDHFGERDIVDNSTLYAEHDDEEHKNEIPFLHLIVE